VQRIEVVRDQENCQVEPLLERANQLVERGGGNGIQTRRGLVEEQKLGIKRKGSRETRVWFEMGRESVALAGSL